MTSLALPETTTRQRAYRIGLFDLEMTNLNSDFGYILCGVVKDYHEDTPRIFRVDQYTDTVEKCACGLTHWNDLPLAIALRDELESYDRIISYNGMQFDLPFLNSRLLFAGERGIDSALFKKTVHKDLLIAARMALRLHSNRLDSVAKFFQFANQKTELNPPLWVAAAAGCSASLDKIVEHCVADVLVLEEGFEKLKGQLDRNWWG